MEYHIATFIFLPLSVGSEKEKSMNVKISITKASLGCVCGNR